MTGNFNLAGRVRFEREEPAREVLARLERALGVPLRLSRQEGEELEYWLAIALGLRVFVELRRQDGQVACIVSCRSDDACYVTPADTVSLDEHLVRLLAAEGLAAQPLAAG